MSNFKKLSIFCLLIASLELVRCAKLHDLLVEERFKHSESVVRDLQNLININWKLLDWQFDSMLYDGNIQEFLDFRQQYPRNEIEMKTECQLLQKKFKDMTTDEAELWYILNKYDWGIIGDDYPVAKPKQQSTESGSNFSGRYQPIEVRYKNFVNLVIDAKSVIDVSGKLPNGTHNYSHIRALHEVEHDFKLLFLKYFETKLHQLKWTNSPDIETNKPNYAYSALDQACKDFVDEFEKFNDVVGYLKWMLPKGNFIQFLVHKKNPGMTEEEIYRKLTDEFGSSSNMASNNDLTKKK